MSNVIQTRSTQRPMEVAEKDDVGFDLGGLQNSEGNVGRKGA